MPRAGSAAPSVRAACLQFLQLCRRHYPTTGVQLAPIVVPGELKAVLRNLLFELNFLKTGAEKRCK